MNMYKNMYLTHVIVPYINLYLDVDMNIDMIIGSTNKVAFSRISNIAFKEIVESEKAPQKGQLPT
jgi:hypothetical protein